ncbi:MAG: dTMP kinase [Acidimicrobiales bacterium]
MGPHVTEPGRLIALEGIDGCGKSTQAKLLAEALGVQLTREPGGTAVGSAIREILLSTDLVISARAEALLVLADRAQHVEEVMRRAIASGAWVVTERFEGSTRAYQGAGRLLGCSLEPLLEFAAGGVSADLSILIDVAPEVARSRLGSEPDRLEAMDSGFHATVADAYRKLAAASPDLWEVVDGNRSVEEVERSVKEAVARRLGSPPAERR